MATIKFYYLHCHNSEESRNTSSGDELELQIVADGNAQTHRRSRMWNGRRWDLGIQVDFNNEVEVILRELDNPRVGDPHDDLGRIIISPSELNGPFTFTGHGTSYELQWGPVT